MTLLKISEPTKLNKKSQKKIVVGIDLGTTNSLVATVLNDKPITVPVSENNDILPSVVHYNQNYSVTVGDKAKDFLVSDPYNTINSVKRCLGKNISEIKDKNKLFSYQMADPATNLSNDDKQIPYFDTQVGPKNPVQVSAEILQKLKLCAEAFIKEEIQGVVVTVPAYFDETQRRLTKDAVRIAGLPLLRLINEPTAAAIAYGLDKNNNDEIIAVYDLGGGTFDISLLKLENGIFEVLATGGDNNFGGDDIDSLLALWILKNAEIEKNKLNASQLRLLLNIAKQAKEQLHNESSVVINFLDWQGDLTKDIFNKIIEPAIVKTINILCSTLIDANISHENLDHIVLVGGSTRIQQIRDKLKDFCAKEPLYQVDPDRVVALGAAIQADILAGNNTSELLLLDVVPLSLGIESMGGIMEKIIDRNTKIPATKSQYFTTYQDGQTDIIINVFQGDRELVKDNRSLAKFILKDIKAMAAGVAKIIVTFQIDADGMLSISAMEQSTGMEKSIEVKPSYGLTEEDIQNMLLDSYSNAEADHQNKILQQQIIESGYLINATQKLIDESDNSISVEEKNQITKLVKQLNIACDNHTKTEIVNIKQKLSTLTEKIAKKQIKFAVEGRKLSNFEDH